VIVSDSEVYMKLALKQAAKALEFGEVPVGCVVADASGVVGAAHNLRETNKDPTAHAEILALREAARRKGTWYLDDCVVYVTIEPCPMCAGAIVNARVASLVYGAADPKAGACGSLFSVPTDGRLNHRVDVVSGVLAEECGAVLSRFFAGLRRRQCP